MQEIPFITSNSHKFEEVSAVLSTGKRRITHLKMQYPELQADSIEKVAYAAIGQLSTIVEGSFLLEDSGLFIDALQGFPGVYSAYIYKTIGWKGILALMQDKKNRKATFSSVFALYHQEKIYVFKGDCPGLIVDKGRGEGGFGFDPVFVPIMDNGRAHEQTFAEQEMDEKNKYSHRSRSLAKLLEFLDTLQ